MGLGDPPVPHLGAVQGGCHTPHTHTPPPGSAGRDVGAFGAAQWDQEGFCGAGGAETSPWALLALPARAHGVGGFAQRCLPELPLPTARQGWLRATSAAPGLSPGTLVTSVGRGCALPGGYGSGSPGVGGGSGAGSGQSVLAHVCVCVCKATSSGHATLCHAVPCCAGPRLSGGWFLLALGRSRSQRCHPAAAAALGTPCTALPRARAQDRAPGRSGDPAPAHRRPWHGTVTAPR